MKIESLSDRMKIYEKDRETRFYPKLPIIARLDGKAFHSFTKGLDRPYDEGLTNLMVDTCLFLAKETGALIGYTQSDEISLVYDTDSFDSQIFMDGKKSKMISILASYITYYFNKNIDRHIPSKKDIMALFDCRVFNIPSKEEACNYLIWREQDATRNSIQMAGQNYFSHSELMSKNCDTIQDMLFKKENINWNDYPSFFKRGSYVQKKKIFRKFDKIELEKLPLKHEARSNPDLEIERTEYLKIEMPIFSKLNNKVEVVFDGENPNI